jgi:3-oxoisoapionate kinase
MSFTPATFAFYGDDFTGSSDSLDMLAAHGVPVTLIPERAIGSLGEVPEGTVVGIAGRSRSMSPEQMQSHLPNIFKRLREAGRTHLHYKVCSTFDSAPGIGNIAVAARLASEALGSGPVWVLGGAPALGRYCVFGHLFAKYGGDGNIYPINRHPVMSQHPVTPMAEADLKLHLESLAADVKVTGVSFIELRDAEASVPRSKPDATAASADLVVFDALDVADTDLFVTRLLHVGAAASPAMVGGSSIEDALGRVWRSKARPATLTPTQQLLVLSGSCSPMSAIQIEVAAEQNFVMVPVRTDVLVVDPDGEKERVLRETLDAVRAHRHVLVHTCLGGGDPRIERTRSATSGLGLDLGSTSELIGRTLAQVLDAVLRVQQVPRVALAGGDFAGNVVNSLNIDALDFCARVDPGVPLCVIRSSEPHLSGVEIALKGGQLGSTDFYIKLFQGIGEPT